jgi:hypothetical protein
MNCTVFGTTRHAVAALAAVGAFCIAFAVSAPQASAVKITNDAASAADIDGNFVYWVVVDRKGRPYAIKRMDLTTSITSVIFRSNDRNSGIGRLRAGGGRLAFQLASFGRTRIVDTIKVANSDGSGMSDLMTTGFDAANDCGEVTAPIDVSATGEVFVGRFALNRTKLTCGDTTNGYQADVIGTKPDGATRTVYTASGTSTGRAALRAVFVDGQVAGENLVVGNSRSVQIIDLAGGSAATYAGTLPGGGISHLSTDEAGRVLVSEERIKTRRKRVRTGKRKRLRTITTYSGSSRLTLFPTRGDSTSAVKLFDSKRKVVHGNFCGSRIVRSTGPFDPGPLGGAFLINHDEINNSGGAIKPIAPEAMLLSDYFFACDATHTLIDGFDRRGRPLIEWVPLG